MLNKFSILLLGFVFLLPNVSSSQQATEKAAQPTVPSIGESAPQKAAAPRSDHEIVADIGNKLFYDRFFRPEQIKLVSNGGIVSLKGKVENLRSKDRALQIVSEIKGVRSIIDQLEVASVKKSDHKLRTEIQRMLVTDPATESFDVKPTVASGVVTLTGTVQSWAERAIAIWVTKGVAGVKDVRDQIGVAVTKNRPAFELEADIKARLKMDPWTNEQLVNVDVQGKKAVLNGFVGTLAAKRRAHEAAWLVGINEVDTSDLKVNPSLKVAETRKAEVYTDKELEAAIERTLLWDPRVNSFKVTPKVKVGTATLTGTVDNLKAKNAAEADARNTNGVILVVNNIKVEPKQKRPDSEILKDINWMLSIDPLVDQYNVSATVKNGKVRLTGTVDSLYEKYYAADDASRIKGVLEIDNDIDVKLEPLQLTKRDSELQKDIARAIRLNLNLEPGEVINVDSKDGTVELAGKVNSWVENMVAVESAFQAGAKAVLNNIRSPGGQIGPQVNYSAVPMETYTLYWVESYPINFEQQGVSSGATAPADEKKESKD